MDEGPRGLKKRTRRHANICGDSSQSEPRTTVRIHGAREMKALRMLPASVFALLSL